MSGHLPRYAEARARADAAEARASDYIKNLLDGRQLTPEGIARLSVLLTPETAGD